MHNSFSEQVSTEKRSSWRDTITLFLALGATYYQISIQTYSWFIFVPIFLAAVSVLLLLRDMGLSDRIVAWFRRRKTNKLIKKAFRLNYERFVSVIENIGNFKELLSAMQNVTWVDTKIYNCSRVYQSTIFVNWHNEIVQSAKGLKAIKGNELELLGDRVRDFVQIFENYYIKAYADALREGQAHYNSEQFMKIVKRQKDRYDQAIYSYNAFCNEIAKDAKASLLIPVNNPSIDLDYIVALKKSS